MKTEAGYLGVKAGETLRCKVDGGIRRGQRVFVHYWSNHNDHCCEFQAEAERLGDAWHGRIEGGLHRQRIGVGEVIHLFPNSYEADVVIHELE